MGRSSDPSSPSAGGTSTLIDLPMLRFCEFLGAWNTNSSSESLDRVTDFSFRSLAFATDFGLVEALVNLVVLRDKAGRSSVSSPSSSMPRLGLSAKAFFLPLLLFEGVSTSSSGGDPSDSSKSTTSRLRRTLEDMPVIFVDFLDLEEFRRSDPILSLSISSLSLPTVSITACLLATIE
jgi:hypothetical protein